MTRKAFLIGINRYKDSPLAGCVNDVVDLRDHLLSSGFKPDDIRTLLDERATLEAIISRLHWLRSGANAGDRLVFHFSGHGTMIRRRNSPFWALGSEACLIPYDYSWNDDDSFVTDSDLDEVFHDLPPGVDLTMIFDSCHSGGMRDMPPAGSPRAVRSRCGAYDGVWSSGSGDKIRYLRPPQDVAWRMTGHTLPVRALGQWLRVDVTESYRTLCACQEDQTASDSVFDTNSPSGGVRPNGAFTWALLKSLKVGLARTWVQVTEDTKNFLEEDGFAQVPVLTGSAAAMNGYPEHP